jgi:hypothetical protein
MRRQRAQEVAEDCKPIHEAADALRWRRTGYYANFTYQAGSWTKPRRVIAKVEWHPGELYPRVGFIVTNMSRRPKGSSPSTTSAARRRFCG